MRITPYAIVMMLILSSGCLQLDEDKSIEENEEDDIISIDLDYIECMIHDDLERCCDSLHLAQAGRHFRWRGHGP